MRTLMLSSFSKNIYDIFSLTINNHIKYCNMHEYSLLLNNEQYTGSIIYDNIINYLNEFDVVFSAGCDVIFTDFNKSITDFIKNYPITISKESNFSAKFGVIGNGEILIFLKKPETIQILNFLKKYHEFRLKQRPCSTQCIINEMYLNQNKNQIFKQIISMIQFIEPGILQSFIPGFVEIQVQGNEVWNKTKFLTHIFGKKHDQKVKDIERFFNEYPEYK